MCSLLQVLESCLAIATEIGDVALEGYDCGDCTCAHAREHARARQWHNNCLL